LLVNPTDSIFFRINLPNPATWFYFSGLLAVALFVKFSRLLSMRNWDVLTMFLFVPGLLLLLEARTGHGTDRWAYWWLLGSTGYFLLRCLLDLILVRRPALGPNLNLGGLAWLAGTLFVSLVAVAFRQPDEGRDSAEKAKIPNDAKTPIDELQRSSVKLIQQQTAVEGNDSQLRLGVERGLAVACHLAVAVGMVLIGWRHFQDLHAGMAAATFYLLLPYTYLLMPSSELGVGRWDDAWPMAVILWAVLAYRRPTLAGIFLGLAAGSAFFPVLLFPVWLSFYWRRGAARFALAFALAAGLCLLLLGGLVWLNGELPRSLQSAWTQSDWQPWREPRNTEGFWKLSRDSWVYRVPVFIAYVAFVLGTAFWPSPKNLAHVLALSAAVLLGIQFWYADHGGTHVLWFLPLLLLMIFRPNLSACEPPPVTGEGALMRLARRIGRGVLRLLHRPEPVTPAA
jgi:hypothetical protein